ncbi:MAG: ferrous iron transport protein A [Oxalobacter sp.]|nr:MAG: ferrous iron transport protein A [Oxalobacter sp.]
MTSIEQLKIGDRAKIKNFAETNSAYRRKLLTMGLTPGVEFQITRVAPMGDPVEIRVRGFSLTLRKEEAAAMHVEKL